MTMTHNECLRVAEAIVAKYKAGKCIPSTADYKQLLVWANDETQVLQVRFNKINVDTVVATQCRRHARQQRHQRMRAAARGQQLLQLPQRIDHGALRLVAHTLKSSSASVGALKK